MPRLEMSSLFRIPTISVSSGRIAACAMDASWLTAWRRRLFKSFVLTPSPGKRGKYQEIERPTQLYWHKLSLSPSETKVAYMLDNDNNIPAYNDDVICYAELISGRSESIVKCKSLAKIRAYKNTLPGIGMRAGWCMTRMKRAPIRRMPTGWPTA